MLTALCIVVGALALIVGLVAAATERLPPWLGGRVARPRVWGLGFALLGAYTVIVGVRDPLLWESVYVMPIAAFVLMGFGTGARRRR